MGWVVLCVCQVTRGLPGASLHSVRMRTAIAFAILGSGVPSTVVTVLRGGALLESTRAAGTLVAPDAASRSVHLVAGVGAHIAISTFWGALLWRVLPQRQTVVWGGLAGLVIAALDLGLVARRFPAIRRLPRGPQVADHVAFGIIVGVGRANVHGRTNPAGTLAAL